SSVLPVDLTAWGSGITTPIGTALMIDPATGRAVLVKSGKLVDRTHFVALFGPLGAGTYDRSATVDPNPTVIFGQSNPLQGIDPGPINPPALPTSGTCEWPDSRTFNLKQPNDGKIADITELTLQAHNGMRPLVWLERPDGGLEWVITAKTITDPDNETRSLV